MKEQWRDNWDQLRTFRDSLFNAMLTKNMDQEMRVYLTDCFSYRAAEFMEDDPERAKQYMQDTLNIVYERSTTTSK